MVNDFYWDIKNFNSNSGIQNKLKGKIKNVNYETKNVDNYKEEPTSELFGAIGLLSEIDLYKKDNGNKYLFSPKMLIRYAPGIMKNEENDPELIQITYSLLTD